MSARIGLAQVLPLLVIALSLLLAGCLLTPEVFDEARQPFLDGDGDGFTEHDGDCAPTDPATYPGAPEVCDGKDNDCDGRPDNDPPDSIWFLDGDLDGHGDPNRTTLSCAPPDGHVATAGDCNDTDPHIRPGQTEACNDIDDDCDGTIDEDAPATRSWFPDADGDGHGSPATPLNICAAPGGNYVLEGDDCDDEDPLVFPGADEHCNGIDDDCDELTDEAPTTDPLTWSFDGDGDGFGDDATEVVQCIAPDDGYVLDGGDCDDAASTTFPGASELCDGEDNDCDGAVDDPPTTGEGAWFVDLDSDGFGDDASTETTCTPEPGMVEQAGDCDDTNSAVHPDATEVCNDGADNDCDGSPNTCVWPSTLEMPDYTVVEGGLSTSTLGSDGTMADLDGDGVQELWVANHAGYDPATATNYRGAVVGWTVPIPAAPDPQNPDLALGGDFNGIGYDLDVADLDGDGYDDLLTGNATDPTYAHDGGGGYIVLGPITSMTLSSSTAWVLYGTISNSYIGDAAKILGDLDSDGQIDFGLGSYEADVPDIDQGAVYLFTHLSTGSDTIEDEADITLTGDSDSDGFGIDFNSLDVDGDGFADLIVGEELAEHGAGGARIFLGPIRNDQTASDADIMIVGDGGRAGASIDVFEDVSGDGLADFVMCGDGASSTSGIGNAYLFWGATTFADVTVSDAEVKFRGEVSTEAFGFHNANLHDVNQDGHEDLGVNSRWGAASTTNAYLYFGPFTASATYGAIADASVILGSDDDRDTYLGSIWSGDVDGDTVLDIMVGSPYGGDEDSEGVLYIVPGVGY